MNGVQMGKIKKAKIWKWIKSKSTKIISYQIAALNKFIITLKII